MRDTYFVLLGLPAGRRPPDYYTLLGLKSRECEAPQIHAAVERQLGKLTPLLVTAQGRKAQRLIGEILQARDVLISRRRKEEYDAKLLRVELAANGESPNRDALEAESAASAPAAAAESPDAPPVAPPIVETPVVDPPLSPVVVASLPAFVQTPQRLFARPDKDLSLSEMALEILQPLDEDTEDFSSPMTGPAVTPITRQEIEPTPAVVSAAKFTPYDSPVETPLPTPISATAGDWPRAMSDGGLGTAGTISFGTSRGGGSSATRQQDSSQGIMVTVLAVVVAGAAVVVCGALAANYQHNARMAELSKTTSASQKGTASTPASAKPPARSSTHPKPRETRTTKPATPVASSASAESAAPKSKSPKNVEPTKPAGPPTVSPPTETKTPAPPTAEEKQAATVLKSLIVARTALGKRDLAAAAKELDLALVEASSAELVAEVEKVKTLEHYVDGFWGAVRDRIKGMKGGEELPIGKRVIIVVEVVGEKIIVRDSGANKTYGVRDLPPALAVALAESWLKKDDPNSAVFVGAFWAVDAKGDPKRGRQILEDAKKSGADAAAGVLEALGPAK